MDRIYERLKNHDDFKDKLSFHESENCLTTVLHEYLRIYSGNAVMKRNE